MRRSRARSGTWALSLATLSALALTLTGTRLASSQEAVLTAHLIDEVPSRAPWDEFWDRVPSAEVPLSAQAVTPPHGGRGLTLSARAVHDGKRLYVLVEWADPTPDRSVARTEDFSDAVAVQFPAEASTQVPAFCMGDPTATVNVWHWRAAWQRDVARGAPPRVVDRYPNLAVDDYPFAGDPVFAPGRDLANPVSVADRTSAADNLVAGGFGSLTPDPFADVQGWGEWREGSWRVIFSRTLRVGRDGNIELYPDTWTDVAFAVWDGGADERDGMKSVANFVTLDVEPNPLEPRGTGDWPLFLVLGAWVLLAAVIAVDLPRAR